MPKRDDDAASPSLRSSFSSYRHADVLEFSPSIPPSLYSDVAPSQQWKTTIKHPQNSTRKNAIEKRITNPSHPAHLQHGLFAARKLVSGERIIDYHGIVTMNGEEDAESDYTYCFARRQLVIDASSVGSDARFCNDYRGIRTRPNAEFYEYRDQVGDLKCAIRVKKDVKHIDKGEEICVNYGKGYWVHRFGREALELHSIRGKKVC